MIKKQIFGGEKVVVEVVCKTCSWQKMHFERDSLSNLETATQNINMQKAVNNISLALFDGRPQSQFDFRKGTVDSKTYK